MIELISRNNKGSGNVKKKKSRQNDDFSCLVPKVGIEPTRLAAHEFESCASTSSATSASEN